MPGYSQSALLVSVPEHSFQLPDLPSQGGIYCLQDGKWLRMDSVVNHTRTIYHPYRFLNPTLKPQAMLHYKGAHASPRLSSAQPVFLIRFPIPEQQPEGQWKVEILPLKETSHDRQLLVTAGAQPLQPINAALATDALSVKENAVLVNSKSALPSGEYLLTFDNQFGGPAAVGRLGGYDFAIALPQKTRR
jgi:hypothetical protein